MKESTKDRRKYINTKTKERNKTHKGRNTERKPKGIKKETKP